ncbi:PREDICTED: uncharacterized protein LOC109468444 [Branchiostoma belcheri]|uniref:Uncharacterized protein LOC109468444 n=1 Tax=Branchiostoma belcheri TaxID=7741 RepID=A0A6P4YKM1_BRABE|nr:PREDICTED: uncharacterized protein LOC109468444 [Branchiostoma belcheri]
MSGTKILLLLFCFAFEPSQPGQSCQDLCTVKRSEPCEVRREVARGLSTSGQPCAICNTTGQTDEDQLGCLPASLTMLQVAGHSDSSGKLKPLPGLTQLRTLILGPGRIRTVQNGTFSVVPNVTTLNMAKNAFEAIGSWFDGIAKLKSLNLSWNEVEQIDENALQPLVQLQSLDLSHNRFQAVEERHFANLTNLKSLHLNNNNISCIAGKAFSHLRSLMVLDLAHNRLRSLNADWLQGLTALRNANFRHNLISTVSMELLAAMSGRVIDFRENPLRCTCAVSGLKTGRVRAAMDWRVYNNLRCGYPPSLSGVKLVALYAESMPCPGPTASVSRRDNGYTLVCEVFWEFQPAILRCVDPRGRVVKEGTANVSYDDCGGAGTTRLEHEFPTTQSPGRGTAHSSDQKALPYIGKSTCTIHMNQGLYQCWKGGTVRCVVQSSTWSSMGALNLTLNVSSDEASGKGQRQETTVTTAIYTETPAQRNASVTENVRQTSYKNTQHWQQDGSDTKSPTLKTDVHTKTSAQRNATETEATETEAEWNATETEVTDRNIQQDGNSPKADTKSPTVMTDVHTKTSAQWNAIETEATDRAIPQDGNSTRADTKWPTGMIAVYILSASLALFFPIVVTVVCLKYHKRHQHQHYYSQGNTADAIGDAVVCVIRFAIGSPPLQDTHTQAPAAPTTVNPTPVQRTDEEKPDEGDTASAQTTRMENPSCGTDATEPKGATSNPDRDPRPRSNIPTNSKASSQPQGSGITQAGEIPDPPPRPDNSISHNPPRPETLGEEIPDPLPRTHTNTNSNVSAQPQDPETTCKEIPPDPLPRIVTAKAQGSVITHDLEEEIPPDPLPRIHTYINSNITSQPRLKMTSDPEEIPPDPLPRIPMSVNPNVTSQPRLRMTDDPEEIPPDPLPRIHTYVNTSQLRQKMTSDPEKEIPPDPLPRIPMSVNPNVTSQPRLRMTDDPEEIPPDPLPRIHTYVNTSQPRLKMTSDPEEIPPNPLPRIPMSVNANVTSQPRLRMTHDPQEIPPDPLPRIHTYVNTSQPRLKMTQNPEDEIPPDPLPRIPMSVNSNVTSQPRLRMTDDPEEIPPDPLPRIHTYVNCNITSQPRLKVTCDPEKEIPPDPLPRIPMSVNPNVTSQPRLKMTCDPEEEIPPDPLPRTHTYVNTSQLRQKMTSDPEKIPDPLPRTHFNPNAQPPVARTTENPTQLRHTFEGIPDTNAVGAELTEPQGLGRDEGEEVESPNIYDNLNRESRLTSTEIQQVEKIPDPLPRTQTYGNSNVSTQPQGSETPAEEIPDPPPQIHTYVNSRSNVSPQPQGQMMTTCEEFPDLLPRTYTYPNSTVRPGAHRTVL